MSESLLLIMEQIAAILSTAREMMYFTKTKRSYFRFAPPTTPRKSGTWPLQTTSHPLAQRAGLVPVVAQVVVTSLIEPYINEILENQKPLSLFT